VAESDGIDEAAEQMLRVALTAAAQLAERLAHARAQAAREAQARSDRDAREHSARVEAEHRAARAQLALTEDPRWWHTATGPDIADVYATARQWADHDPSAAHDADRITQQVPEQYGSAAVPIGASSIGQPRATDRRAREQAAAAEAAVLLASDARADIATRTRAWLAEHAHELPAEFTRAEAGEAVSAGLRADLTQPQSATEATAASTSAQITAESRPQAAIRPSDLDFERS
jgi:hypothetical protein